MNTQPEKKEYILYIYILYYIYPDGSLDIYMLSEEGGQTRLTAHPPTSYGTQLLITNKLSIFQKYNKKEKEKKGIKIPISPINLPQ